MLNNQAGTLGCVQGTFFCDLVDRIQDIHLPSAELRTLWLYTLTKCIATLLRLEQEPSVIHSCVPCKQANYTT